MGFVSLRSETASSVKAKAREKSGIPKRDPVPEGLPWQKEMAPDVVQLFRFSAIPSIRRIHYDRTYAMEVEGYRPCRTRSIYDAMSPRPGPRYEPG